jgi:hypothetical protein
MPRLPKEELKLTARFGGGWLAPLACRIVNGAPQLNSGALARGRKFG